MHFRHGSALTVIINSSVAHAKPRASSACSQPEDRHHHPSMKCQLVCVRMPMSRSSSNTIAPIGVSPVGTGIRLKRRSLLDADRPCADRY